MQQTTEEILKPKVITDEDLAFCQELGATLTAGLEIGVS